MLACDACHLWPRSGRRFLRMDQSNWRVSALSMRKSLLGPIDGAVTVSISSIHSYLVHPGKLNKQAPKVSGVKVAHVGKLFGMVEKLDHDAEGECDIDIVFKPGSNGA